MNVSRKSVTEIKLDPKDYRFILMYVISYVLYCIKNIFSLYLYRHSKKIEPDWKRYLHKKNYV